MPVRMRRSPSHIFDLLHDRVELDALRGFNMLPYCPRLGRGLLKPDMLLDLLRTVDGLTADLTLDGLLVELQLPDQQPNSESAPVESSVFGERQPPDTCHAWTVIFVIILTRVRAIKEA